MTGLDAAAMVAVLRDWAAQVAQKRDWLIDLDRAIGDADHGANMDRGLKAVVAALDGAPHDTPGAVLKAAATTLISTVGGAAGPLYGTALLRGATTAGAAAALGPPEAAAVLQAAAAGLAARGKASVGDKTMVDAWSPAADAARAAADGGGDLATVLGAAAAAGDRGAQSTIPLVARKGRASYLGERSAGHLDPGSASTVLLLQALARAGGAA